MTDLSYVLPGPNVANSMTGPTNGGSSGLAQRSMVTFQQGATQGSTVLDVYGSGVVFYVQCNPGSSGLSQLYLDDGFVYNAQASATIISPGMNPGRYLDSTVGVNNDGICATPMYFSSRLYVAALTQGSFATPQLWVGYYLF